MPAHKLLLHPQATGFRASTERIATALREIGLVDTPRMLGDGVFYSTGPAFLQLVTFLGCSPAIELDPPQDPARVSEASASGTFCHVFVDSHDQPRFRHDPHTPAPACPSCHRPLAGWPGLCAQARDNPLTTVWTCTACGRQGEFAALRLRRSAAIARCWVEIRGVHPAEAVPSAQFLQTLHELGGGPWHAIYLRE